MTNLEYYNDVAGYLDSLCTDDSKRNTYKEWSKWKIDDSLAQVVEGCCRIIVLTRETIKASKPTLKAYETFDKLDAEVKQNLLMETAMAIMEIYYTITMPNEITGAYWEERYEIFRAWALEFENKYYGTPEYDDDYPKIIREFIVAKCREMEE